MVQPRITQLGHNLRSLRFRSGERLLDMGQRLDLSPAMLSSIELGRRMPPDGFDRLVCNRYFLSGKEASALTKAYAQSREDFTIVADGQLSRRVVAAEIAKTFDILTEDDLDAIMRVVLMRKDMSGLEDRGVSYCPKQAELHMRGFGCGSTDFIVPPLEDNEIGTAAAEVRDGEVPLGPDYLDIIALVEQNLYARKLDFLFEVQSSDELMADGLTSYDGSHIAVREDIYVAACGGKKDARFVVAHELGHHKLHASSTPPMPRAAKKKVPVACSSEHQADVFARSLLAPVSKIDGNDDKYTVSKRFGLTEAEADKQIQVWRKMRNDSGSKLLL